MAKLKVDEIETISTNQSVEIKTSGSSGALEIKGGTNDGILQLNCSAQSHGVKLKAPATGQNWTAVLPEEQVAANTFLRVKSTTGSGTTAVGQLEYGQPPTAANILQNLDAAGFTSGTVPAARMPAMPASGGLGLQLISKTVVPDNTSVQNIDFTLESNSAYHIVGKSMRMVDTSNGSNQNSYPVLQLHDGSGSLSNINYTIWEDSGDNHTDYTNATNILARFSGTSTSDNGFGFTLIVVTGDGGQSAHSNASSNSRSNSWFWYWGNALGTTHCRSEIFAGFSDTTIPTKLRIYPYNGWHWMKNSTFLMYKFNEN